MANFWLFFVGQCSYPRRFHINVFFDAATKFLILIIFTLINYLFILSKFIFYISFNIFLNYFIDKINVIKERKMLGPLLQGLVNILAKSKKTIDIPKDPKTKIKLPLQK